jgi:hypothetical protein
VADSGKGFELLLDIFVDGLARYAGEPAQSGPGTGPELEGGLAGPGGPPPTAGPAARSRVRSPRPGPQPAARAPLDSAESAVINLPGGRQVRTADQAPGAAGEMTGHSSPRRRWAGLVFISLGVAMIIVDATIVNVAIPQIIKDLHITSTNAQWVQDTLVSTGGSN